MTAPSSAAVAPFSVGWPPVNAPPGSAGPSTVVALLVGCNKTHNNKITQILRKTFVWHLLPIELAIPHGRHSHRTIARAQILLGNFHLNLRLGAIRHLANVIDAQVLLVLVVLVEKVVVHDVEHIGRQHRGQTEIAHFLRHQEFFRQIVALLHLDDAPRQIRILSLETLDAQILGHLLLDHEGVAIARRTTALGRRPIVFGDHVDRELGFAIENNNNNLQRTHFCFMRRCLPFRVGHLDATTFARGCCVSGGCRHTGARRAEHRRLRLLVLLDVRSEWGEHNLEGG